MSHLRTALLVVAAASIFPPAGALAAEPAPAVLTLRAGAYLPQGTNELRAGPDVSLALGREFFSFLAGDLSIGYARTRSDPWYWVYTGPGYETARSRIVLDTLPVSASVRALLPTTGVRPYLLAGAGVVVARVERTPLARTVWSDLLVAASSETHVVPEVFGGAGFLLELPRGVDAGLEGRYTYARIEAFDQNGFGIDGLRVNALIAYSW
jgi:hypothetical protein